MNTTSGEAILSILFCLPSENGFSLMGNTFLPLDKVDPISEGAQCTVKQTGNHESVSLGGNRCKSSKCSRRLIILLSIISLWSST